MAEKAELWDEDTIEAVWKKGKAVSSDPDKWRKDDCGAWISRERYRDRDSIYGWEIDHIKPKSEGGSDDLENLRPLQWKNNVSKSNKGRLECVVESEGKKNVEKGT